MKLPPMGHIAWLTCLWLISASAQTTPPSDTSPHKVMFITVDEGVKLEVLDFGGTGPPLVLLTGLGDNAHVFDQFALNFTGRNRVYGITRRGYGRSDKPAPTTENYDANRLGDDVLAVIAALNLDRPVLAGHSIAGEELSSIGSRHPERIAGLIYLDAHGPAAFYNSAEGNYFVDMAELLRRLNELSAPDPALDKVRLRELQQSKLLQRFDNQVGNVRKLLESMPSSPANAPAAPPHPDAQYGAAINRGQRIFTDIKGPILAIAALPHDYDKGRPPQDYEYETRQTAAFEKALSNARVVRLPYASHYVFRSNETEVVREMNAFIETLD
jgi:non-heme chloroperoxidase